MRTIWMTVLLIFIVVSTSSFLFFKSKPRDYVDMAHEIRAKVGKQLAQKHHFAVVGITGGMMDCVYLVGLSFQIYRPMDRDEARYRLVDCVEEMLRAINENEEIRPYLKNYPFTTNNIRVDIFMSDPDGRHLYDPNFEVASISESNKIEYCTSVPNLATYKHKYEESYEEALALVKSDPKKYPLGFAQQNEVSRPCSNKRKR